MGVCVGMCYKNISKKKKALTFRNGKADFAIK